jgi:hypothetical protein
MSKKVLAELQHQNTWRLLGLSLITYFVYAAHYVKRQTKVINQNCDDHESIPDALVSSILGLSYLSLGLFVAFLFVEETHPIAKIGSLVDRIGNILFLVWGFKARSAMNSILRAERGSKEWFHGFWTFMFSPMYLNIKVNKLSKDVEQTDEPILSDRAS